MISLVNKESPKTFTLKICRKSSLFISSIDFPKPIPALLIKTSTLFSSILRHFFAYISKLSKSPISKSIVLTDVFLKALFNLFFDLPVTEYLLLFLRVL